METNKHRFILDVHLGKLARTLRMLGFDTCYNNSYSKKELLHIAFEENRLLFTRNVALCKHPGIKVLIINSSDPMQQLLQVVKDLSLTNCFAPFTRCLVCNGALIVVPKEEIEDILPANTKIYYNDFWQCSSCKKIYWKGPHFNRMMALVSNLKTGNNAHSGNK